MDQRHEKARERAARRAERTFAAWSDRTDGTPVVRTPHGEVILADVQFRVDGSGLAYLDVTTAGGSETRFRVVNPPILVRDPDGDVEVRGERYRQDPLQALADAVGSNGGAVARKRRHGR